MSEQRFEMRVRNDAIEIEISMPSHGPYKKDGPWTHADDATLVRLILDAAEEAERRYKTHAE